jgi:hypothetical protein
MNPYIQFIATLPQPEPVRASTQSLNRLSELLQARPPREADDESTLAGSPPALSRLASIISPPRPEPPKRPERKPSPPRRSSILGGGLSAAAAAVPAATAAARPAAPRAARPPPKPKVPEGLDAKTILVARNQVLIRAGAKKPKIPPQVRAAAMHSV